jgi:hypothetical protein
MVLGYFGGFVDGYAAGYEKCWQNKCEVKYNGINYNIMGNLNYSISNQHNNNSYPPYPNGS